MSIGETATVISAFGTLGTLTGLVISLRKSSKVNHLDTLQRMVSELNQLRQFRAVHPDMERELFPSRGNWSDERIAEHLSIVQLANTLEWAYIARRAGLLELDVWQSWVSTWQNVIGKNARSEHLYDASVWTFGRTGVMFQDLQELSEGKEVVDPFTRRPSFFRRGALFSKTTGREEMAGSSTNQ